MCIQDLGHVLYAAVMLPKFYKIISLEKKKKLYKIEASNTASLHRIFKSLEVTTEDFCGVAGTPADSKGRGCVKVVSERNLRKPMLLSIVVFVYIILHYCNHAFSNSKYIHLR